MNVSVSVICYKYKTLSNGEHPLMLRIIKDRKRSMKSLGFSIQPQHWDFEKELPTSSCPNKEEIIQLILKTKLEYQKRLLDKSNIDEEFTASSLLNETNEKIIAKTVEEFYKKNASV